MEDLKEKLSEHTQNLYDYGTTSAQVDVSVDTPQKEYVYFNRKYGINPQMYHVRPYSL